MESFDQQLCDWYAGEAGGEAFFLELSRNCATAAAGKKWKLLAELERVMGERLLIQLNARGIDTPETEKSISQSRAYAATLTDESWETLMTALHPRLERFVCSIRADAAAAPSDATQIADEYIAHEEALLAFVSAENDLRDGTTAVTRLLEIWSTD